MSSPQTTTTQSTANEFSPLVHDVLVRIIQVAFPHKNLPDGPYERIADTIIEKAGDSTWLRIKLLQGVESLNTLSGGQFLTISDADALRILKSIEHTEFFAFIRSTTVVDMYEDEELWEAVGYEGPSFDKGGYINRGFSDLDWLPEPRIEEYDGPDVLVDIPGIPVPRSSSVATGVTESSVAGHVTSQAESVEA